MPAGRQHYTGDEGRAYHGKKRAIPSEAFPWVAELRARRLQPEIEKADVVFEYGVGSGWNLAALKCASKFGYDVTDFVGDLSQHGIQFERDLNLIPPACANVVICYHTLEHVVAPADVLSELRRFLKPNGKLLLFVPFEKESRYRKFNPREPNHHLYSWNVQTLGNLVQECGWSIGSAGVQPYGYERIAAQYATKFKLGEPAFRLIRRLVWLIAPILEVKIVARPKP